MSNAKQQHLTKNTTENTFLPIIETRGILYEKFKHIYARNATTGEEIRTITNSGLETINIANEGDFIAKNLTENKEQYIIEKDSFPKLYTFICSIDKSWNQYKPLNKIHAVELTEDLLNELELPNSFTIVAKWNQDQQVHVGSYIVNSVVEHGIYCIEKTAFESTYVRKES